MSAAATDTPVRPAWRIDAHHHLWDLSARPQPWIDPATMAPLARSFTLDDLRPLLAAAGVASTVLVQSSASHEETVDLLAIAAADGSPVAAVVGWTDLTAPDVADRIAALRAAPGGERLAGIRHVVQAEPDPDWLNRADVLRGLRAVADAGLVYDLLTAPHQLPAALRAARALPGLRLVLDHLSKPPLTGGDLSGWERDVRALAALPDAYCKLSGMVTEAHWDSWTVDDLRHCADTVLDAFGPERVMFGSDWPVCLLAASYAQVAEAADRLTASLTASERTAVWAGTAASAYRLPAARGLTAG
ncbi:amidohydrolase family protein [Streptomyces sp. NPDC020996]|uniref:amidohydrolase family protein n=1 Tax=Streptomyces sp. NPDC020996 TaxID=3154791 RepID=UPI0033C08507